MYFVVQLLVLVLLVVWFTPLVVDRELVPVFVLLVVCLDELVPVLLLVPVFVLDVVDFVELELVSVPDVLELLLADDSLRPRYATPSSTRILMPQYRAAVMLLVSPYVSTSSAPVPVRR